MGNEASIFSTTLGLINPKDSSIFLCVNLVAVAVRPTNGVLKKMFESNPNLPQAGLKSFLFK